MTIAPPRAAPLARRVHRLGAARGRGALSRPSSLPRPHARGKAHASPAPAVGAQSLLLPDAHSHQGRHHSVEVGRSRIPPHVDSPHPRPRRRRSRRGGLDLWLRLADGVGLDRRGGGELPVRAPRRALRLRCLRGAGARAHARGGGGVVAHRVLRPRSHVQARARLGEALPVGQPGDARVFPLAGAAGPARLRWRPSTSSSSTRPPTRCRSAAWPPSSARRRSSGTSSIAPTPPTSSRAGVRAGRAPVDLRGEPAPPGSKARLRFDRKSSRYMLLYPERGLVLNPTAADVLQRCDGRAHRGLDRGGAGADSTATKSPPWSARS